VVEDNAQAQGAAWAGGLTGSFGHADGTSFTRQNRTLGMPGPSR
jgi:dTDP-4-amino-4,6-dideoxygalactose transaminase